LTAIRYMYSTVVRAVVCARFAGSLDTQPQHADRALWAWQALLQRLGVRERLSSRHQYRALPDNAQEEQEQELDYGLISAGPAGL
jgi:hypothetical protein